MSVVLIVSLLALGVLGVCLLCLGHMLSLLHRRLLDVEQALAREHGHLASGVIAASRPGGPMSLHPEAASLAPARPRLALC